MQCNFLELADQFGDSMFTGTAIGGELLQLSQNGYLALILFASGSYIASFAFLLASKLLANDTHGLWSVF